MYNALCAAGGNLGEKAAKMIIRCFSFLVDSYNKTCAPLLIQLRLGPRWLARADRVRLRANAFFLFFFYFSFLIEIK